MSTKPRKATFDTFTLERRLKKPPATVFRAFADHEIKRRWFGGGEGWELLHHECVFKEGGYEREASRRLETGVVHDYRASFIDVVPDTRIVTAYEMSLDDDRISVSINTVELVATDDGGTHLKLTEQGTFLDGVDDPSGRREGTDWLLSGLEKVVDALD